MIGPSWQKRQVGPVQPNMYRGKNGDKKNVPKNLSQKK